MELFGMEQTGHMKTLLPFETGIVGDGQKLRDYKASDLYEIRSQNMYEMMAHDRLSDEEIHWWKTQEESMKKPFLYHYNRGPLKILSGMQELGIISLLLAAVCLSVVFAGEHRQKTDQLVLCGRHGTKQTYYAKIAAGTSFMLIGPVLLFVIQLVGVGIGTGLDGMHSLIQLELPLSAYPLTMGQAIWILFGILLVASILFALASMFFSELFKNGVAVMGVMMGVYFFADWFHVSEKYRILSQMTDLFPTDIINMGTLYDHRLVGVSGHYVTNLQAAPILYAAMAILLFFMGKKLYGRYQVGGR